MRIEDFKKVAKIYGWVFAANSFEKKKEELFYVSFFKKLHTESYFKMYESSQGEILFIDAHLPKYKTEIQVNINKYSLADLVIYLNKICSDDYVDFESFYNNELEIWT